MNGRERIEAVLQGHWLDQRPVMIHNFMMAARESNMTMATYRSCPEQIAKAHISAAERYQLDGVFVDIDTATTAGALGATVDFPEDEPARCHGQFLSSLQQVDDLEPVDLANNERVMIWVEACRKIKNHFGDELFVRGNCDQLAFSVASMLRSPAEWMMDLMDPNAEESVFKLLDYCHTAVVQFTTLMADTGVDMISHGDSPAGPDMISPAMYRKFALPYEKKAALLVKSLGCSYMLHVCGNTEAILSDIATVGADGVELDYKTDVNAIRQHCDTIVLSGIIDPSGVLALGTPQLVIEKTRELLAAYHDSPRLIVCSGCALPPHTPAENIHAMVDTARQIPMKQRGVA
jgi:uroporphyrinogen decarboxylase